MAAAGEDVAIRMFAAAILASQDRSASAIN